jgi:hypothetical protein
LPVYSVRERREQRYANNSEKRTIHSIKRQARGGVREGGLFTGGLLYYQPSHGNNTLINVAVEKPATEITFIK